MKSTKVILNQDVYNLGEEGDVRDVAPGYARNFLIPQGLAVAFSKQTQAEFEQRKDVIEKRKEEKRFAAKNLREKVEATTIELEMPAGDSGKLFGSVNSANIAEQLTANGVNIERKKIDVPDNSIKMVGEYTVRVRLYGDEVAEMKVVVNPVGGKKVTPAQEPKAEAKAEEAKAETEAPAEAPVEADAAAEKETAAEAAPEETEEPAAEEAKAEEIEPQSDDTAEGAAEGEASANANAEDDVEPEAENEDA